MAEDTTSQHSRRDFLSRAAMATGLAGGYGAFGMIAGRYLYPARSAETAWLYVSDINRLSDGESLLYEAPDGEKITVTRSTTTAGRVEFVAMSSTCPHLGCQVQWEPQNSRYFCPCHNGVFNPEGVATEGPPADAKQSLKRYPAQVEDGLLFLEVRTERLVAGNQGKIIEAPTCGNGPGHDPCLSPIAARGKERPA